MLTLNVSNPPTERAERILHWLWPREEDVWVLTEVGRGQGSRLLERVCRAAGHAVIATDRSERGVLVVARQEPLRADPVEPMPVLPGRIASVVVGEADPLRLLGVYGAASDPVRYSSAEQRQRKRDWLTAFDDVVVEWRERPGPALLVGDLNIVDPDDDPSLRYVLPEEREAYGRLVDEHGLVDAYRQVHPDASAPSWFDHTGVGCRYDHAFVTDGVEVLDCDLDDGPRDAGLSDHSALVAGLRTTGLRG